MPQEIVVPVIKFKGNKKANKIEEAYVEVEMSTISKKITTPRFTINFFQKDMVEDKKQPIMLKARFEDEAGNVISNEISIIADSKSSNAEERVFKERFALKSSIKYDKKSKYYLVMIEDNHEVDEEYKRYEFIIDIAIQDDFGF